jgi:[ribosomal protein S5]-alanine N-acetyltransferase
VFEREIAGARLRLRPFAAADVEDVLAYASEPIWGRYLPVPAPYTRADAEEYLASHRDRDWTREPVWACELGGRVVGGIDLHVDDDHRAWIGYSIAPSLWGRGLATEAAGLVIDHAFTRCSTLLRIYATCDADNVASARVMAKVGMRREGILRLNGRVRGRQYDEAIFAILRDEWSLAHRVRGEGD